MATAADSWFAAAKVGRVEDLQGLAGKVDPNIQDELGNTALHWAAGAGHPDAVKAILAVSGADPSKTNKMGETAAHKAGWKGSVESCEALASAGCDLTIRNNEGQTAKDVAKDIAKSALEPPSARLWDDAADDEDDDGSAASDSD